MIATLVDVLERVSEGAAGLWLASRSLPRTTSGKLQRGVARERWGTV